jgi:hypothetical protein
MSTNTTKTGQTMEAIKAMPQRVTAYIVEAFTRIFRPANDDYPATGTQPFEGDTAKKKHY